MKPMAKEKEVKDFWDKLQAVGIFLGAVGVPFILGMVGGMINSAIKEREVQSQMVQLAVGILEQDPRKESEATPALRDWATKVIDQYSGVPFSIEAKKELSEKPLPLSAMIEEMVGRNSRATCDFEVEAYAEPSAGPAPLRVKLSASTIPQTTGNCGPTKSYIWKFSADTDQIAAVNRGDFNLIKSGFGWDSTQSQPAHTYHQSGSAVVAVTWGGVTRMSTIDIVIR